MKIRAAYSELTKDRNRFILDKLRDEIKDETAKRPPKKIAVLITGSDGRLEKGYWSKPEPIIIREKRDSEEAGRIKETLVKIRTRDPFMVAKFEFETKTLLDRDEIFAFAFCQRGRSYPQRVWDSQVVFGSDEYLERAKDRVVEELKTKTGQRIKSDIKDKKGEFRKAMISGRQLRKGSTITNYNLETGESFFEDFEGSEARSFKHGPLRFVQFCIVDIIVSAVREAELEQAKKFLKMLPTPTDEKMEYLYEAGKLRVESRVLEELKESYAYFLLGYHNSEREILQGTKVVPFDAKEARERIEFLTRTI